MIRLGISARSLAAHPFRSFLSALGVIFGVGSVVAMVAVGEGARREALSSIAELGVRNIFLRAPVAGGREGWAGEDLGLSAAEAALLLDGVPGIDYVVPVSASRLMLPQVADEEFEAVETTGDYLAAFGVGMQEGRFLGALDVDDRRLVCVLGHDAAASLGTSGRTGMTLRIGGRPFEIVGLLADREWKGGAGDALPLRNVNRAVFLPLGTLSDPSGALGELVVHAASPEGVLTAAEAVKGALRTAGERAASYQAIVPLELLRHAGRARRIYSIVLGSIAAISLLVGGIGIMNIMLASVTDRRREIGIRRAVGASRRDIVVQFLGEALILTVGGGAAGLLAGAAFSLLLQRLLGWPTEVTWWSCALSLATALAVGLSAGIYPALQAARVDPVEAIRYE